MSKTTLRPNGTTSNGSSSVTGAASRHAALNDNSDSSYVTFSGSSALVLAIDNWSQPAGSVMRKATTRLRAKPAGGTTWYVLSVLTAGSVTVESDFVPISGGGPGPHILNAAEGDPTPADFSVTFSDQFAAADSGNRLYELYVDVVYVTKPTVTVTAPTGTIEENQPTIKWSRVFDADATGQRRVEVKVYTDAQYGDGGFDPDTSTPTAEYSEEDSVWTISKEWTLEEPLPNDTYRAYVRMASWENGEWHWSDWDSEDFVVDAALPGDPSLTLTPQPNQARIKIELDDTTGDVATSSFQLQRSLDQQTWETVRHTADTIAFSGSAVTLYDPEAPNEATVYYRARAFNMSESTYSGWTTDNSSWSSEQAWIKHPFDPSMQLAVKFKSAPGYRRERRATVHQGINATHAYVVEDTPGPKQGTLELWLHDASDRSLLDDLLYCRQSLLIDSPGDWDCRWVRLVDTGERVKVLDQSWNEVTAEVMQWIEMPRPSGNLISEPPAGDDGSEDLLLT